MDAWAIGRIFGLARDLVFQPTLKVDPVRPDVDIPPLREIPEPPALVLRLPLHLQTPDHPRRQPRSPRTHKLGQRLPEVPARNSQQIQRRQRRVQRARPPREPRQDRRGEPDPVLSRPAPVPYLRPPHQNRSNPRQDLTLRAMPVTHQSPTAHLGPMIGVGRQQRRHLRFHGVPHQLPCPRSQNLRQPILNSLW